MSQNKSDLIRAALLGGSRLGYADLAQQFGVSESLVRYVRARLCEQGHDVPLPRAMSHSKSDLIRAALLGGSRLGHADLARQFGVSRSLVQQVRERLCKQGHDLPPPHTRAMLIRAELRKDRDTNVGTLARRLGCCPSEIYEQRRRLGITGRHFVQVDGDPALLGWLEQEARRLGPDVTPGMAARAILADVMHQEAAQ
jgi:transposase-like protein